MTLTLLLFMHKPQNHLSILLLYTPGCKKSNSKILIYFSVLFLLNDTLTVESIQIFLCFQVSLVALMFRQTNILWVVFIAGSAYFRNFEDSALSVFFSLSPGEISGLILTLLSLLLPLWPYVVVGLTFALFLVWNGSVVVGDKTHHQMHLHLPQIFYFVSFSFFFSFPYLLGNGRLWLEFVRQLKKKKMIFAVICVLLLALVSVHFFT